MTDEVEQFQNPGTVRMLWLSLLAGPVVWAVYFFSGYLLNEVSCRAGWFQTRILGLPLIAIITIAYTLLALVPVVFAGLWAYRRWQSLARQQEQAPKEKGGSGDGHPAAGGQIEVLERSRFVTFSAMLLSLLFGLTILLTGIPSLVLGSC